jgi:hypothetical protein
VPRGYAFRRFLMADSERRARPAPLWRIRASVAHPRPCGAFAPARPALRPPLAVWARLGIRHYTKRAHHGAIDDVGAQNSGSDDIVVSRTIKDIVAGSGIKFEDFGVHVLKGVPDDWQLYRVADLARADAAF